MAKKTEEPTENKTSVETDFDRDMTTWQQTPDRQRMVDEYCNLLLPIQRQGIPTLVAMLAKKNENGMTFFDEPASTKYHGAKLGGLVKHCLDVYKLFDSWNRVYELQLPQDSVVIAALLHDLCKWQTYYPNLTNKGVYSQTKAFEVIDVSPLGHGEKSVIIVNRYVALTPDEELLIRWHMGPYDYNWKGYEANVKKRCRAVEFLYLCDNLSAAASGLEE